MALDLSLGLQLGSSSTAFTPASITTIAWFDPSDLSTMYQSGTRASPGTAVAADGDPVGLMLDKSGNQRDFAQATAGKRPVYKTSGGLHWLQFTRASAHGLATATGFNTGVDYFAAMAEDVDLAQWVTGWDTSNTAEFFGVAVNGSGAASSAGVGTPADFTNGVAADNTRGGLYTALVLQTKVLEIQGMTANLGGLGFGDYSSFEFGGKLYGIVITATNTARSNIRTYLGAKAGLSL